MPKLIAFALSKVMIQRGVPNACAQYTPIFLFGLTASAMPISLSAGFVKLAQCGSVKLQSWHGLFRLRDRPVFDLPHERWTPRLGVC